MDDVVWSVLRFGYGVPDVLLDDDGMRFRLMVLAATDDVDSVECIGGSNGSADELVADKYNERGAIGSLCGMAVRVGIGGVFAERVAGGKG